METLRVVAAAASLLASLIAGGVALYVKASIGPIVTRLEDHGRRHLQSEANAATLFEHQHKLGERVARLEVHHSN